MLAVHPGGVSRDSADVAVGDFGGTVEGALTVHEIPALYVSRQTVCGALSYDRLEIERSATVVGAVRPIVEEAQ